MWTWKESRLNPANQWRKRIEADLATYPARFEKSEAEGLIANYTETAREARRLYLGHIALLAYGALTIFTARDAAFYNPQSAIPLPLLGVMISANFFSIALPIMLLAFWLYLQIYLGQMRRYRRLLYLTANQYPDLRPKITPDARFPWIATIAERSGPTATLVRGLFDFLAYWSTHLLILGIWWRILTLRSTWYEWLSPNGHGLPAAGFVGLIVMVSFIALCLIRGGQGQIDGDIATKLTNTDLRSQFQRRSAHEIDLKRTGRWSIAAKLEGHNPRLLFPSSTSEIGRNERYLKRLVRWGIHVIMAAISLLLAFGLVVPNSWLRPLDDLGEKQWFLPYVNLQFAKLSRPAESGVLDVVGINLPRVRLPYANLHGAYLEGANFIEADLRHANLSNARLKDAILPDAHLEGASLFDAHLEGASLSDAHLEGATLWNAHLEGASLSDAHLEGATLWKAHLEGASLFDAHLEGAKLREADLKGAKISKAHLEGASLWNAHLEGADLFDAHLEGAKISKAHLEGASLWNAHLEGADLWNAHLEGANLFEAHLEGANLFEAHLEGAKLREADLKGAFLWNAYLEGADLSSVSLEGADLTGASLEGAKLGYRLLGGVDLWNGANLSDAHLEGADLTTRCENCPEFVKERLRDRSGKPTDFTGSQAKKVCGQGWPGFEGTVEEDSTYCEKVRNEALKSVCERLEEENGKPPQLDFCQSLREKAKEEQYIPTVNE